MQYELIQAMKTGEIFCSRTVSEKYKTSRPHASQQLRKAEKRDPHVVSFYVQKKLGTTLQCVKYYKYVKN